MPYSGGSSIAIDSNVFEFNVNGELTIKAGGVTKVQIGSGVPFIVVLDQVEATIPVTTATIKTYAGLTFAAGKVFRIFGRFKNSTANGGPITIRLTLSDGTTTTAFADITTTSIANTQQFNFEFWIHQFNSATPTQALLSGRISTNANDVIENGIMIPITLNGSLTFAQLNTIILGMGAPTADNLGRLECVCIEELTA